MVLVSRKVGQQRHNRNPCDERHNTKKCSTAEKDGRPQIRPAVKEDGGHHKRPAVEEDGGHHKPPAVEEDLEGVQLPDEQQPGPSASKKKKRSPKCIIDAACKNKSAYL
ncbi:Hypothetical predicted protein [Mytilus galloprovincialis]|uniref:Uncharacterized protein n=1 Tax=Mytilus galloprovincialis TaxID=29158 RepID=A0A8B6DI23_MYTGA|nr:Hypothetical predicted protein [Mytilus galloprovincialis]